MAPGLIFVSFVVVLGLASVATAIGLALRPSERALAVLRPLSAATAFSGVSAAFLGVANLCVAVARSLEESGQAPVPARTWGLMFAGLAEGTIPVILAFALLSVAWLLAAVGMRRHT
jgi:hypothetical protein